MYRIESKKTGQQRVVTEDVWRATVNRGNGKNWRVLDKDVAELPVDLDAVFAPKKKTPKPTAPPVVEAIPQEPETAGEDGEIPA